MLYTMPARKYFVALAALGACVAGAAADSAGSNATREVFSEYTWQTLGNGIYVHMRTEPLAGPVDGNSIVIINDEDVFVVDTHINPAAARAVIGRIRELTDKPVSFVVNTHWHDDHTNGNHAYKQAFPEVEIVSHQATLKSLRQEWEALEDGRRTTYADYNGDDLRASAAEAEADDPERAIGLRVFAGYVEALAPELPAMQLVYPDLVFADRMEFERGERRIVLQWMGRGNTDGDVIVWLPEDDVLITGDVLVAPIPYAFDSPMIEWVGTLGRLRELGPGTIIPGHGAVQRGTRYLEQVESLLELTIAAVRDANAAGVEYAGLAEAVDLRESEAVFTQGDPVRTRAWRAYYYEPGLASAWASLGYPVPEGE